MWNFFKPKERIWYQWRLDGGQAYLRKDGEEWQMSIVSGSYLDVMPDSGGPEPVDIPEALAISFAVGKGTQVALRPHFGTLPYLFTLRNEVRLLPGAEVRFSVALPPLLRFELEDGTILGEKQLFNLSPTWFGDKLSGNLCASLPLALDSRSKDEIESTDTMLENADLDLLARTGECKSLIHTEILVRNTTKSELDLKRLALFTELMNIYEYEGKLFGDQILIDTGAEGSLRMSVKESSHRNWKKIHTGNKTGLSEVLVRRGVNFLKSITGM